MLVRTRSAGTGFFPCRRLFGILPLMWTSLLLVSCALLAGQSGANDAGTPTAPAVADEGTGERDVVDTAPAQTPEPVRPVEPAEAPPAAPDEKEQKKTPLSGKTSTTKRPLLVPPQESWVRAKTGVHVVGLIGAPRLLPLLAQGVTSTVEVQGGAFFSRHFFVQGEFALVFGEREGGVLKGYRGRVRGGLFTERDQLSLRADLHAGITSVSRIPIPRTGIGGMAAWRFVDVGWLRWDGAAELDLDLLAVAPAPAAGLSTGIVMRFSPIDCGVRVGARGEGIIALAVNAFVGEVYGEAFVGGRF